MHVDLRPPTGAGRSDDCFEESREDQSDVQQQSLHGVKPGKPRHCSVVDDTQEKAKEGNEAAHGEGRVRRDGRQDWLEA